MLRPRRSRRHAGGLEPLDPRRRWMTITVGTIVLAPAYWMMLLGLIALGTEDSDVGGPSAVGALAFGLAVVPFVFIVLAFGSWHPSAPGAVLRAMALFALVAIPVSAIAADAVTGLVAGAGAGGVAALRADLVHERRHRIVAVGIAAAYAFLLARTVPPAVIIAGPALPFTAIGMADHWSERQAARRA
ncbi:MAG TPA: hypothetical protein VFV42_07095 [Acidimicrobiales bacterium]|nr:hypothetical protein [Acidimicrobiales bacterium]